MDISITCANCSEKFVISTRQWRALRLNDIPKHCPRCNDIRQQRRPWDTVVRREMLASWEGVLIALPKSWFVEFRSNHDGSPHPDRPCKRATIKGNRGQGVSWTGRIDVYDFRTNPDGVGRVRLMKVEKEAGKPKPLAKADRLETLADRLMEEAREQMAESSAPEPDQETISRVSEIRSEARKIRASVDRETEERIAQEGSLYHERYQYIVIEDSEIEVPVKALIWVRSDYKTTLKGFGRQYHAHLDTSRAEFAYSLSSACRSSRFGSYMAIAIVADDSPVIARVTGDIDRTTVYDLTSPTGREE